MDKKKKIILIASISLVLLIGILGVTFAYYSNRVSANSQQLITGDIWMRYNGGTEIIIDSSTLIDSEPATSYDFTITGKNTSNKTIVYDINVLRGDLPDGKTESQRIADKFIKFTLKRSTDGTNYTDVVTRQSYNDYSNGIRLYVDNIGTTNNVTYYYKLYTWISPDVVIYGGDDDVVGDYRDSDWPNMFARVKVKVTGDFENKTVPVYINLNPNGGEVSSSMIELASNATSYGTLPTPTNGNMIFDGWYTAKTGGEKVESNATYTHGTSATTLYAHWRVASMSEMCPGCEYMYTTNEYYYNNGGDETTRTKIEDTDGVTLYSDYNDVVTNSGKPYFLGVKFENDKISKAYVCGIKGEEPNQGTPFCIEGYIDGTKQESNINFLTPIYGGACSGSLGSNFDCNRSVRAFASSDGFVDVIGDSGHCSVYSYGFLLCIEW